MLSNSQHCDLCLSISSLHLEGLASAALTWLYHILTGLIGFRSRRDVRRSPSLSHTTFHNRHCREHYKTFVSAGRMFYIGFKTQLALVEVFRSQITFRPNGKTQIVANHSLLLGHTWMQCTAGGTPCRAGWQGLPGWTKTALFLQSREGCEPSAGIL